MSKNIFAEMEARSNRLSNLQITIKEFSKSEDHKRLVKQANLEIEKGRQKYAHAITNAMNELPCSNNFNEEFYEEMKPLNFGGKLVSIPEKDKGTPEDYAKLEAKILSRCKEHESYTK